MFFGIHNHTDRSNFRLRDSINRIEELINYSHELGHKGVCITEHETVASSLKALEYYESIKDKEEWKDFKLALGNEIYLCKENVCAENRGTEEHFSFPHFILIALDSQGHEQIRELSTRAWLRGFQYRNMMRVPTYWSDIVDIIGSNPGHVVGATACLGGSLPKFILKNKESFPFPYQDCLSWIDCMASVFGKGNFFLEMQPSYNEEQIFVNKILVELSGMSQIPYVISTDTHYLKKEDAMWHEIYLKSQDGDREVADFYASTYVMSEGEIHEYMDDGIGAEAVQKGIDNTMLIYDKVQYYSLTKPLRIPYLPLNEKEPEEFLYKKYLKDIPSLSKFYESKFDCDRHMVREITESLESNITLQNKEVYDHLEGCLNTILISSEKMNTRWSAYLLNEADYIKVAWEKGDSLVGAARGSGMGFGLLYVLGITQINPLNETTKTFPWRFLNPERASTLD